MVLNASGKGCTALNVAHPVACRFCQRCLYAANGAVMRTAARRVRDSLRLIRSTSTVFELAAYSKLTMYLELLTRNIYNCNKIIIWDIKLCECFVGQFWKFI